MDTLMLQRDEATRDRVRQALEFLDPRTIVFVLLSCALVPLVLWTETETTELTSSPAQMTNMRGVTDQTLS